MSLEDEISHEYRWCPLFYSDHREGIGMVQKDYYNIYRAKPCEACRLVDLPQAHRSKRHILCGECRKASDSIMKKVFRFKPPEGWGGVE